jgi:hypothetical protein
LKRSGSPFHANWRRTRNLPMPSVRLSECWRKRRSRGDGQYANLFCAFRKTATFGEMVIYPPFRLQGADLNVFSQWNALRSGQFSTGRFFGGGRLSFLGRFTNAWKSTDVGATMLVASPVYGICWLEHDRPPCSAQPPDALGTVSNGAAVHHPELWR